MIGTKGILCAVLAGTALFGGKADAQATATTPAATPRNPAVYRVTYTLTETDSGKRVGVQHYTLVLTEGGRSTMKNGSKIPIATGSYNPGSGSQTQFTYLDIGVNIDTRLSQPVDGTWQVTVKVEQSSVADDKLISGVNEPVIRQSVLDEVTSVTLGKPQVVGTLDLTGSTRHLEVEVLLEPLK